MLSIPTSSFLMIFSLKLLFSNRTSTEVSKYACPLQRSLQPPGLQWKSPLTYLLNEVLPRVCGHGVNHLQRLGESSRAVSLLRGLFRKRSWPRHGGGFALVDRERGGGKQRRLSFSASFEPFPAFARIPRFLKAGTSRAVSACGIIANQSELTGASAIPLPAALP